MIKLKELIKVYTSPFFFLLGYLFFVLSKKNPNFIHQSYVKSYCLTSGIVSELITTLIKIRNKFNFWKNTNVNSLELNKLKKGGYVVLKNYIEDQKIQKLYNLTNSLECSYNKTQKKEDKVIYDEKIHKLPSYGYETSDLIRTDEIKDLIKFFRNSKIINLVESYFESKAYILDLNMWWSNVSNKVDSFSAQDFHFDLDSIKFLKVFIYLKDVTENKGPHVYVEGSHKLFSKPYEILKRGYSRVSDSEILKYYDQIKIHKIVGKKGTIIIGDTKCFHKGLVPKDGNRLIFELTFSNSKFGSKKINNVFLDDYIAMNNSQNV